MSENKTQSRDPGIELRGPPQEQQSGLPAVIEPAPPRPQWRRRPRGVFLALLLLIGAGAGIGWFWWQHHQLQLPPGIAWGNGRLEADEIDIDTKFAGRIAKLFADEGDMVKAGQVVAVMDTQDLQASLKKDRGAGGAGAARARRGEGQPRAAADPGQVRPAGTRPHQRPRAEGLRHRRTARPADASR